MTFRQIISLAVLAAAMAQTAPSADAEEFTNALRGWLEQQVNSDPANFGMVAGIVDEHGSSVVSYSKPEAGAQTLTGDTLFDIAFLTRTFTTLLLQDMVDHQILGLHDPISAHLPASLKIPPHNGREITILDLTTAASGVPDAPGLAEFLAPAGLNDETKHKNLYSTIGMAMLGQIIARQAGSDYESLVVSRICRPLEMNTTRVTLTPELEARCAIGHDDNGQAVAPGELDGLLGGVGLYSTANDLLKYLSAQVGLRPSPLSAAMKRTQGAQSRQGPFFGDGLAWRITHELDGREVVWLARRGGGCLVFVGMEPARRRAVVVLSNSGGIYAAYLAGMLSLESEWRDGLRPKSIIPGRAALDNLPGQYQLAPNFAVARFILRQYVSRASTPLLVVLCAGGLGAVFLVLWLAPPGRARRAILSAGAVVVALGALSLALILPRLACAFYQPGMTIRRQGDRLLVQYAVNTNRRASPLVSRLFPAFPAEFWPVFASEILPASDTLFFNRLTGAPLTYSQHRHNAVLVARLSEANFKFVKTN